MGGVVAQTPTAVSVVAIILAGILLLISGFTSASETAFYALSPADLNEINEKTHPSDKRISDLLNDFDRLMATLQIANTTVNVAASVLFTFFFLDVFRFDSSILAVLILAIVIIVLLLLFGELMP